MSSRRLRIVELIRDAKPEERDTLVEMQRRASMTNDYDRPFLIANPDAIELPPAMIDKNCVRVAVNERGPIGFSVVLPLSDEASELDGLFVEPEFMRRGVGRELVLDALERLRARQLRRLEVNANPAALGFYTKMGFSLQGVVSMQFGVGHRMRLDVASAPQRQRGVGK